MNINETIKNLRTIVEEAEGLDSSIRDWYMATYPTDELGASINPEATFRAVYDDTPNVYDILGDDADSIVRERVFAKLAEIQGEEYDDVYNKWLKDDSQQTNLSSNGLQPKIVKTFGESSSDEYDYEVELLRYKDGEIIIEDSEQEINLYDAKATATNFITKYSNDDDLCIASIIKGHINFDGGPDDFDSDEYVYGISNKDKETTNEILGDEIFNYEELVYAQS